MCRKRIALSSLVIWLATLFYAVPTFAGHCTASNAYLTYAGDVGTYPSDGIGLTGGQEVRQELHKRKSCLSFYSCGCW